MNRRSRSIRRAGRPSCLICGWWRNRSRRRADFRRKNMGPVQGERFYLGCLAHASYIVASEGVAAVIDPQRDVDIYLDYAREKNLRIEHIIETHLHADFVSGHHELAERTGARIYLGEDAHATFPHTAIKEGDTLKFGNAHFNFLHTPGHTIEGVCAVLTDL